MLWNSDVPQMVSGVFGWHDRFSYLGFLEGAFKEAGSKGACHGVCGEQHITFPLPS